MIEFQARWLKIIAQVWWMMVDDGLQWLIDGDHNDLIMVDDQQYWSMTNNKGQLWWLMMVNKWWVTIVEDQRYWFHDG